MSLSNSKVSETLFHKPETRIIIAENPLDMENWGNHCLSLDTTSVARIIHTSVKSLTTHFWLENEPCFSFLNNTRLFIFLFALSYLEVVFLDIFSNETNTLQKKFRFLRIFICWWSQLYWICYIINGNALTRRCNQGQTVMSKFIHAHKYMH